MVLRACYIMKPKEEKKVVSSCAWWSKKEEKDCVITFWLSELSLIQWTVAKSLVHLDKFAEIFLQKKTQETGLSVVPSHSPTPNGKRMGILITLSHWILWFLCSKCVPSFSIFSYTNNPHFMNCRYLLWLKHTPIFQALIRSNGKF